jgi:hypothetical protein
MEGSHICNHEAEISLDFKEVGSERLEWINLAYPIMICHGNCRYNVNESVKGGKCLDYSISLLLGKKKNFHEVCYFNIMIVLKSLFEFRLL